MKSLSKVLFFSKLLIHKWSRPFTVLNLGIIPIKFIILIEFKNYLLASSIIALIFNVEVNFNFKILSLIFFICKTKPSKKKYLMTNPFKLINSPGHPRKKAISDRKRQIQIPKSSIDTPSSRSLQSHGRVKYFLSHGWSWWWGSSL